jgi:hypothetical protein
MYDPNTEFRFNSYIDQMVRRACDNSDDDALLYWLDVTIDEWKAEAERGDGFTWARDAADALEQIEEAILDRVQPDPQPAPVPSARCCTRSGSAV